jgi:hypothetical protein
MAEPQGTHLWKRRYKFWFIKENFSRQTDQEIYGQIIMFQIIYLTLYCLFGLLRIEDSLAQRISIFSTAVLILVSVSSRNIHFVLLATRKNTMYKLMWWSYKVLYDTVYYYDVVGYSSSDVTSGAL